MEDLLEYETAVAFADTTGAHEEHENLFQIRQEKERLKQLFQKEEFQKMMHKSHAVLNDLDTY